ncbi:MAG: hypothetical protein ACEQSC_02405, partial [Candidatus Nanopelagicaceae bacterium]
MLSFPKKNIFLGYFDSENFFLENQKQILSLSTSAKVPLLVAIQPEITGRNPTKLTPAEGQIITTLGRTYIEKVRKDYPALTKATFKLAKSYPS